MFWVEAHGGGAQRISTFAPDGRRKPLRHVLEARHESWLCDESLQLLKDHDVALVTADTAGKFPLSFEGTASFAYLRLHGSSVLYTSRYTDRELADWAKHIRRWRREGRDVYVYFDNDAKVYAPSDAMRLCNLLDPQLLHRGGEPPTDAIQANL